MNQKILVGKIGFDTAEKELSKVYKKGLTPYNYNSWMPSFQSRKRKWNKTILSMKASAHSPSPISEEGIDACPRCSQTLLSQGQRVNNMN